MIATKTKVYLFILGFTFVLLGANAQAAALGKVHIDSTILEPLQLHVALIDVEGVLPNSMAARVAGPAQFLAAGLTYQEWYSELNVNVVYYAGKYFLQVLGQHPVEQNQLDFIFELNYAGDWLLAEYSIELSNSLPAQELDEQTKEQSILEPKVLVTAIEAEVVLEQGLVQLSDPQDTAIVIESVVPGPVWVIVKPGQTLWSIAVKNSPKGINPWQELIVLYKQNPRAFMNGDIRKLRANSHLRLPTLTQLNEYTIEQSKAAYQEAVLVVRTWVVVKPGQTSWRIAVDNSPKGISPWQTLITLYRTNLAAFRNGDIRQILANSRLRLPTLEELNALTADQAKASYDVLVSTP